MATWQLARSPHASRVPSKAHHPHTVPPPTLLCLQAGVLPVGFKTLMCQTFVMNGKCFPTRDCLHRNAARVPHLWRLQHFGGSGFAMPPQRNSGSRFTFLPQASAPWAAAATWRTVRRRSGMQLL